MIEFKTSLSIESVKAKIGGESQQAGRGKLPVLFCTMKNSYCVMQGSPRRVYIYTCKGDNVCDIIGDKLKKKNDINSVI